MKTNRSIFFSLAAISLLALSLSCNFYREQTRPVSFNDPASTEGLEELPMDATYSDVADLFESLDADPEYNAFIKLMNAAGMIDEFKDLNGITVFAPTRQALARLDDEMLSDLQEPQYLSRLREIILYHIVPETFSLESLASTAIANDGVLRIKTLHGGYITIQVKGDTTFLTDEQAGESIISDGDKRASNGIIHGIDSLLIPTQE